MFKRPFFKKSIAYLVCIGIFALMLPPAAVTQVAAIVVDNEETTAAQTTTAQTNNAANSAAVANVKNQINNLNDQYDKLEAEQKSIQNQLNQIKNEKQKQQAEKAQLENQISITKEQIALLVESIALLEDDIKSLEAEIESLKLDIELKEAGIDMSISKLKTRLSVMYMSSNANTLSLLLGSDSFSGFLTKVERMKNIADHDQAAIEELMHEKEIIELSKLKVEQNVVEVQESREQVLLDKAALDEKNALLSKQVGAVSSKIQDISEDEKLYQANQKELKAQMDQLEADLEKFYSELTSYGDFVGGTFLWPVPGYSTVTSEFGWRWGGTNYHTGFDISGANVYGKPVVASNSGKVVFVNHTYVASKGYGKYIIIDHGGGFSTLYAHLTEINVTLGQIVVRGETVGKVGSTGWSTGPHLHFEVRENSTAVNPRNYVSYK